ncbi:DUF2062 domain-containing protein [Fodinisporobacter ferrooxydans]|uniref:DUF2062 domain-containing protein n=1 Tax=Fodinisporobacter ferrooxydans TaxID=2901836 RepID=A0ABY4CHW5_9BACL|nr:DUF2062 domain-containing protein [Alicyclobacillaceae bacterium MYW30-H2]
MNHMFKNKIRGFARSLKLQYIKLLRSPGGARKVATGFAIGFGLEMLVLSTAMVVYVFLYPIVRIMRGSLSAAIIGNLICKATFLPVLMLPVAMEVGRFLTPFKPHGIPRTVFYYLHTLLGMSLFAGVFGFLSFFPVYYLYEARRKHRENKRREKRQLCPMEEKHPNVNPQTVDGE